MTIFTNQSVGFQSVDDVKKIKKWLLELPEKTKLIDDANRDDLKDLTEEEIREINEDSRNS
jgi:hypothetical protein